MRVNVYAEEMTDRVEIISKEIEGRAFTGLRIYLHLPATENGQQHQGPFIHRDGDDDSSAVTFWGKRDLREVLKKSLTLLDEHYARAAMTGVAAGTLPAIGAGCAGGTYAGITLENGRAAALVLLPGDESMPWKDAKAWAERQGGVLPSRHDAIVLFDNLKRHFKPEWYWTSEQLAADSASAWTQSFSHGGQTSWPTSYHFRARAVRRVPIQ